MKIQTEMLKMKIIMIECLVVKQDSQDFYKIIDDLAWSAQKGMFADIIYLPR